MLGYGRDKSAPTPCGVFVGCLRGGSYIFYGVFCGDFVDKYGAFVEYSQHIRNPFEMYSRNVRNVFIICMLHNRHSKVWFLPCKSMVFGVQKGGFWRAKVWFL